MDPIAALIFLGILTMSGLFSGTETALTAVSEVTLVRLADSGHKSARLLRAMLVEKGRVIAALLVGNNVVNVILAVYATVVFNDMIQGTDFLPPWAGPIVASVASVVFLLVFGEVLPKSLAVSFRTQWAMASAYPVAGLMLVTRPITWVLMGISHGAIRLMGRRMNEEDIFDVREIHTMAHMSEQAGVIDTMEKQLIQRAAQLNDTRVREIMIPRTDIQGIEAQSSLEEIRALFQKTPFSRIPVYGGDLDDIIGILNFKEFLRHEPERERAFDLIGFLHKPLFVPDAMFIGDLLNEMRAQRSHLAIALDEYGGTAGLITLEDVVEMLVGRIEDEYDAVSVPIQQLSDNEWMVDGRVIDDRLVVRLGLDLPDEALDGFDTVGGLALKAFGNIPSEGDVTTYYSMELTAVRVKGHRVRRVRIRIMEPAEAEQAAQRKSGAEASQRRKVTRRLAPAPDVEQPQDANRNTGDEETTARKTLDEPELLAPKSSNEQEPK